jgi:hypothetical protein
MWDAGHNEEFFSEKPTQRNLMGRLLKPHEIVINTRCGVGMVFYLQYTD